jgi:hypothetical protein
MFGSSQYLPRPTSNFLGFEQFPLPRLSSRLSDGTRWTLPLVPSPGSRWPHLTLGGWPPRRAHLWLQVRIRLGSARREEGVGGGVAVTSSRLRPRLPSPGARGSHACWVSCGTLLFPGTPCVVWGPGDLPKGNRQASDPVPNPDSTRTIGSSDSKFKPPGEE